MYWKITIFLQFLLERTIENYRILKTFYQEKSESNSISIFNRSSIKFNFKNAQNQILSNSINKFDKKFIKYNIK